MSSVPRPTQDLAAQYLDARTDQAKDRTALAPLRAAKREAERALAPALEAPVHVRVGTGAHAPTLRLEAKAPAPPATTRLGIRALLPLVRRATEEAARDRAHLDARLRHILARELEGHVTSTVACASGVRPARISVKLCK